MLRILLNPVGNSDHLFPKNAGPRPGHPPALLAPPALTGSSSSFPGWAVPRTSCVNLAKALDPLASKEGALMTQSSSHFCDSFSTCSIKNRAEASEPLFGIQGPPEAETM